MKSCSERCSHLPVGVSPAGAPAVLRGWTRDQAPVAPPPDCSPCFPSFSTILHQVFGTVLPAQVSSPHRRLPEVSCIILKNTSQLIAARHPPSPAASLHLQFFTNNQKSHTLGIVLQFQRITSAALLSVFCGRSNGETAKQHRTTTQSTTSPTWSRSLRMHDWRCECWICSFSVLEEVFGWTRTDTCIY